MKTLELLYIGDCGRLRCEGICEESRQKGWDTVTVEWTGLRLSPDRARSYLAGVDHPLKRRRTVVFFEVFL